MECTIWTGIPFKLLPAIKKEYLLDFRFSAVASPQTKQKQWRKLLQIFWPILQAFTNKINFPKLCNSAQNGSTKKIQRKTGGVAITKLHRKRFLRVKIWLPSRIRSFDILYINNLLLIRTGRILCDYSIQPLVLLSSIN